MKLTISKEDFQKEIDNYIDIGSTIKNRNKYNLSSKEFEEIKKEGTEWIQNVILFLNTSLEEENNMFTMDFKSAKPTSYIVQNIHRDDTQIQRSFFDEISEKESLLKYYSKLIPISDLIINPNSQEVIRRKTFNTKQKLELILEKLYDINDDRYHSIQLILELNGIKLVNYSEDREFANVLKNYGYIEIMGGRNISAKLNMQGKMYIEGKRDISEADYEKISSNQEDINKKVDEIIAHLTKLGYGQEIIFEEIEELKELYTKLNKKNWGQVLKGKLIDLSISKLVENDTISYIFEKLTHNHLQLP